MQRDSELVRAVHEHWVLTGVEAGVADDMADELADHLSAAVADGKEVEAVVGPDIRSFADEWAAPVTRPTSTIKKLVIVAFTALLFASVVPAVTGVASWAAQVALDPVKVGVAAILGGFIAAVLVGPITSQLGPSGRVRSGIGLTLTAWVALGVSVGGWVLFVNGFGEGWAFTVPTWLAVAVTALSFFAVVARLWELVGRLDRTEGWTKTILRVVDLLF